MRRGPLARRSCRLVATLGLTVAVACSSSRDRQDADNIVGSNNRGVGLMGQFKFDEARKIFADPV